MTTERNNTDMIMEEIKKELTARRAELDGDDTLRQVGLTVKVGRGGRVFRTLFSKLTERDRD